MKVEVNRNDESRRLVIDELGNIGILMHNGYIWLLKHSGKPVDVPATTFDKGPLQFEIDEQLNTTWYKE